MEEEYFVRKGKRLFVARFGNMNKPNPELAKKQSVLICRKDYRQNTIERRNCILGVFKAFNEIRYYIQRRR